MLRENISSRRTILCLTWLKHYSGPAGRPVRYLTLTEYRREVAASAVAFHPVRVSSGSPLPLSSGMLLLPKRTGSSILTQSNNIFLLKRLAMHQRLTYLRLLASWAAAITYYPVARIRDSHA
ncbi:hypothetical protein EVAR_16904_1 [Eumeta japonica]|uniref:Uncharacterized protein n=1 Tax=Eumeta variegata TaxID=151549 RepID=A0A4C1TVA3_EUMVA|nr:hypothetical protein EVAR_16904_1 [Eumeta japonica]